MLQNFSYTFENFDPYETLFPSSWSPSLQIMCFSPMNPLEIRYLWTILDRIRNLQKPPLINHKIFSPSKVKKSYP